MATISKDTVIRMIAERTGATLANSKEILETVEEVVLDVLFDSEYDSIKFAGGTFHIKETKERTALANPKLGKAGGTVVVPASKKVSFKTGSAIKAKIKG